MSSIPVKRSRKVTNLANKMLAALEAEYYREQNLHAEVPVPRRMVTQYTDPTSHGEKQPQKMDDSSKLPDSTDTGDISFNLSVDGVQEDVEDVVGESTAVHNCINHASVGDCLRDWAVMHNQPRSSVNEILAIFRQWTNLPLPKDSRGLLKTPATIGLKIQTI